ncbi:MAG: pyridoxal phosphate-dependent aminotransferase [Fibrobacteria bacterium]
MFSDTFARAPEGPNPQWEARLAREASGLPVLDLTGSNPTTAGIPYPAGIPGLLAQPPVLRYEPSPKGHPEARQTVAAYYAARGRLVDPEDLVLTSSTSEAYSFLFKLLCNPGDEILIPTPAYPLFDSLADLEHVELVRYPLKPVTWKTDFPALRNLVSTRCKALVLVHPNNPTGHLTDGGEIREYLEIAADYGLALIVDEVFRDYLLVQKPYEYFESRGPLVFTLNGISKSLGLPQLKLGWIHVAGGREAVRMALGHLEWIADAFLSVNSPVQIAASGLLRMGPEIQSAILGRVRRNLDAAEALIGSPVNRLGSRLRLLNPEAGWSLILDLDIPLRDEAFALGLMERQGVQTHAGHLFGFEEGCRLVVSLIGRESEFAAGLRLVFDEAESISRV